MEYPWKTHGISLQQFGRHPVCVHRQGKGLLDNGIILYMLVYQQHRLSRLRVFAQLHVHRHGRRLFDNGIILYIMKLYAHTH